MRAAAAAAVQGASERRACLQRQEHAAGPARLRSNCRAVPPYRWAAWGGLQAAAGSRGTLAGRLCGVPTPVAGAQQSPAVESGAIGCTAHAIDDQQGCERSAPLLEDSLAPCDTLQCPGECCGRAGQRRHDLQPAALPCCNAAALDSSVPMHSGLPAPRSLSIGAGQTAVCNRRACSLQLTTGFTRAAAAPPLSPRSLRRSPSPRALQLCSTRRQARSRSLQPWGHGHAPPPPPPAARRRSTGQPLTRPPPAPTAWRLASCRPHALQEPLPAVRGLLEGWARRREHQ